MAAELINILLVEDNPGDAVLAREALVDLGAKARLRVVSTGIEAMAFLRRQPPYANETAPDLILLDLNLPAMNGREVLAEIRNDNQLGRIPLVILTSSRGDSDIIDKFNLLPECYIVKPTAFADYTLAIKRALELRTRCRPIR